VELANVTENNVVTGKDGGRGTANMIYILYILGFFTGITSLVGVVLAYTNRDHAAEPFKSHLSYQIRIFWRGITFMVAIFILNLIFTAIGVATLGLGLVLEIIPIGVGIWWFVWTIMAIVKGMGALGRQSPIA
jgi:uncharacterized membrane protein